MSPTLSEIYDQEIEAVRGTFQSLLTELRNSLSEIVPGVHISGRVKSKASLLRKAYSGKYDDYTWNDYHDIIGFKVLTYRKADLDKTLEFLRSAYADAYVKSRVTHPEHLDYSSTHLIVRRDQRIGHSQPLAQFEIQFRTLTEDAWYVIDHQLAYKPLGGMKPDDVVLRKVKRLLILAEIFDEEVELLMSERESSELFNSARAFEQTAKEYDELTGIPSGVKEPSELFGLLFSNYEVEQRSQFLQWMPTWVVANTAELKRIIAEHSPGAQNFVETRDWIFTQPEILLLAERASNGKRKAMALVKGQDNEELLVNAIEAFSKLEKASY